MSELNSNAKLTSNVVTFKKKSEILLTKYCSFFCLQFALLLTLSYEQPDG